jgi:cytochrome c peroxidase
MLPEDRAVINTMKGNMGIVFDAHNRRLTTPNSPFERYVRDQDASAISERAKNGLRLFIGKASCIDCHRGGYARPRPRRRSRGWTQQPADAAAHQRDAAG